VVSAPQLERRTRDGGRWSDYHDDRGEVTTPTPGTPPATNMHQDVTAACSFPRVEHARHETRVFRSASDRVVDTESTSLCMMARQWVMHRGGRSPYATA
jgi:hypothetical protein